MSLASDFLVKRITELAWPGAHRSTLACKSKSLSYLRKIEGGVPLLRCFVWSICNDQVGSIPVDMDTRLSCYWADHWTSDLRENAGGDGDDGPGPQTPELGMDRGDSASALDHRKYLVAELNGCISWRPFSFQADVAHWHETDMPTA